MKMLKSLDEIFEYRVEEELRAVIETDDKLLHPYSILKVNLFDGKKKLTSFETIFKCDIWEGCKYCFTNDLRKLYFEKGRKRIYADIEWRGCINFRGTPVFEDSFFEKCLINDKVLLYGRRVLIFNLPDGLELEEESGLVKIESRVGTFYAREVIIM